MENLTGILTINIDLLLDSYDYDLPADLIAQRPLLNRDQSRLLSYNCQTKNYEHLTFLDIANLIPEGSLLVANQSKVVPARLFGKKVSGAKAEILFLSFAPNENGLYSCLIKTGSKKKVGDEFIFSSLSDLELSEESSNPLLVTIENLNESGAFEVSVNTNDLLGFLNQYGVTPIPPYIRDGVADTSDHTTYQTVYAKDYGSVAAPTAGLHFTSEVLSTLKKRHIEILYVTLHVGPGTFAPVKSENILDHKMHSEEFYVSKENVEVLKEAYQRGREVFAVGTTSLRVLESLYPGINSYCGKQLKTDIFLYPGKEVKSISGLITNFHLPKSTLLMLVSALVGREKTLDLYNEAVKNKYRFFSYGDAMFIRR